MIQYAILPLLSLLAQSETVELSPEQHRALLDAPLVALNLPPSYLLKEALSSKADIDWPTVYLTQVPNGVVVTGGHQVKGLSRDGYSCRSSATDQSCGK